MTCRELAEFILAYLDGGLPVDQRAVFDRHQGICPDCRAYLNSYEATVRLSRTAYGNPGGEGADAPPAELVAAVLASRRAESK